MLYLVSSLIAALSFRFLIRLFPIEPLRLPAPSNLSAIDYQPHFLPIKPTQLHALNKNTHLKDKAELLFDELHGVESVTLGPGPSTITLLDRYGYVHIADASGDGAYDLRKETSYIGPGRPLGSHYLGSSLIICDSLKGLTEWDGTKLTVLSNKVTYANDLDVDSEAGMVYFSDSQTTPVPYNPRYGYYDTYQSAMLGLMSGHATGRVLAYNISSRSTGVLAEGLFYANGVALSQNKDFLLVVETYAMTVTRVWLKGDRRGQIDASLLDLTEFGFPDGINRAPDGSFWVAILSPRNEKLAKAFRSKWLRWIISYLPTQMRPKLKKQGLVLRVSEVGEILSSLWDEEGQVVGGVSAVVEGGEGELWLGNLQGAGVWRVRK